VSAVSGRESYPGGWSALLRGSETQVRDVNPKQNRKTKPFRFYNINKLEGVSIRQSDGRTHTQ